MAEILKKFTASYTLPSCIVLRSKILLLASEGENSTRIAKMLGISRNTVNTWRKRFHENASILLQMEEAACSPGKERVLHEFLEAFLSDRPRPGKPPVFTPEEIILINELACKNPKDFGYELSHWNLTSLAQEAVRQGIVPSISPCPLYLEACAFAERGIEVCSTDEMTGVQALERKYQDKPVCPGRPALHEFEYIRHGTLSLIAFLRVADGLVHAPYINQTRNEQDFCCAVRRLVSENPDKEYITQLSHKDFCKKSL